MSESCGDKILLTEDLQEIIDTNISLICNRFRFSIPRAIQQMNFRLTTHSNKHI